MRKLVYIICINILSLNLERQVLIILLVLTVFQIFELIHRPYHNQGLNKYAASSMQIIIFSYFIKLLSYSFGDSFFDKFCGICILVVNCEFYAKGILTTIQLHIKYFNSSLKFLNKWMIKC